MNKSIIILLLVICFTLLSSARRGGGSRGGGSRGGGSYRGWNRGKPNYGGSSHSNHGNGYNGGYGSSFKPYKNNYNKASSILKNNKNAVKKALIAAAGYKLLKKSTKIFSYPNDDYYMYIPAYRMRRNFNINNNKPYTQFIFPVEDMYLNCLVVPKSNELYNVSHESQYTRDKECSKIFKNHVKLQSKFYPPSHYNNTIVSTNNTDVNITVNNTDVINTARNDTTLCCIPNASKPPASDDVMTKYSFFTAFFCIATALHGYFKIEQCFL